MARDAVVRAMRTQRLLIELRLVCWRGLRVRLCRQGRVVGAIAVRDRKEVQLLRRYSIDSVGDINGCEFISGPRNQPQLRPC